ncbi:hypothetical protein [Glycomyces xiaoerkulensis]|uniref:hypothetical protein n=1 Tax=Glycomyces xiaoerkulensis TaxID=2038139 RepID=UPI0018E4B94E|nr:hypothetical protein [Glycomyces xiaoerkulensis]
MEFLAQEFGPDRDQAMAGPLGLFITLLLVVVTIMLVRGMNKHVRRLNRRLDREAALNADAEPAEGPSEGGPGPDRA